MINNIILELLYIVDSMLDLISRYNLRLSFATGLPILRPIAKKLFMREYDLSFIPCQQLQPAVIMSSYNITFSNANIMYDELCKYGWPTSREYFCNKVAEYEKLTLGIIMMTKSFALSYLRGKAILDGNMEYYLCK